MNISRRTPLLLAILTALGTTGFEANAQLTINVGNIQLLPNTPDQLVTLNVSGVSAAAGLDFYVQIADGFPDVPGSSQDGPNITSVDIIVGTLFENNNDSGQVGSGLGAQHQYRGVLTESGTVSGSDVLASIRIDTTGFNSGSWGFKIKDVHNAPTQTTKFYDANFDEMPANITDGTITVVPEPAAYGVVMGFLAIGLAFYRRSQK